MSNQKQELKNVSPAALTTAIGGIVGASVGTIALGPVCIGAGVGMVCYGVFKFIKDIKKK